MNADKRRRARVQGGWAATGSSQRDSNKQASVPISHASSSNKQSSAPLSHTPSSNKQSSVPLSHVSSMCDESKVATNDEIQARSTLSRQNLARIRFENGKPPMVTVKNVDNPKQSRQNFIFEDPEEEIKMKPADIVITKPGVYDVSIEPSGISRLRYFPQFIDTSRSEAIFAELLDKIPWKQRSEIHNGVQAIQPRLTAWYSDLPYTYAGITVEANTAEWPEALKNMKEQLAEMTNVHFNSLAANLYRDGHDSIGWHSDDEPIMGKNPTIASISFGEERMFELRKKPPPGESGERDYSYSQVIKLPLSSGTLLIMEGWTQSDWQHRVPKEYHDRGARINITFRVAKPFEVQ